MSELFDSGEFPNSHSVTAYHCSVQYMQVDDKHSDDFQKLTISTDDNGAGAYIVISTERWGIDSIDDLINTLNDFKKRFPIK